MLPAVIILSVLAFVGLHWWWHARYHRLEELLRRQTEPQRDAQPQAKPAPPVRLETFLSSMTEGVVVLDGEGRIGLANQAFVALFGVTDNPVGKPLAQVCAGDEQSPLTGPETVVGMELRLPGVEARWVRVNATTVPTEAGQPSARLLVFHDLTRLKQLERTREEFVANVSHELRTPLSLIKAGAETLLDGARHDPAVAERFLHIIERNADRLRLLIDDLLTISELESGRVRLNLQSLDLRAIVDKAIEDMRSRAMIRAITLDPAVPELEVRADGARLEQVLFNLLDNAIKYGRPDGHVTVRARRTEGGLVEVSVEDDGPGLPPDALERIFDRFYRVDKARSREQGGTGLGLSIVKHIVQCHGGRVWARSELGKGARFFFTLPAAS